MPRLRPLATLAPASLRLILVCYADQHPEVKSLVAQRLKDPVWFPTPDDCPGTWEAVQRWYAGLERTGQLIMDSY